MRILHISSARTLGDAERYLTRLSRELTKRGHEVFIALRPTSQWQSDMDFLPQENVVYVSVRNPFGILSVRQIARFVDDREIDVIHAHSARDYLAASVVRRSGRAVRLVVTRHVDQPLKPFYKFALRNVDAVIAVSPAIGEQLTMTFPPQRIFTVLNGIDVDERPHRTGSRNDFRTFHSIPRDAPLIATIGELEVAGGQRDLLLAAQEILDKVPDCHFVIAGSDRSVDKKFRRELKRLAKVMGLEHRFLWLEPADEAAELIDAADLIVSASHIGKVDTATVRASAAMTAVITTAADEIIDPRSRIPAMDPLSLAEKITLFLTDDELRHSVAMHAQAAVRDSFSLSRMVDETENVYREAIKR